MNKQTVNSIDSLRLLDMTPTAIARSLGVSVNTVKSHIRRHPELPGILRCLSCGKPVEQTEGRKAKKFCSDKCRMHYWNHKYRNKEKNDG